MKVKICGITCIDDAEAAARAGADYIGFVFAMSPRRIDLKKAGEICGALEQLGLRKNIKIAGVFVNEKAEVMKSYIEMEIIDIAQIHGDETAVQCVQFDFPYMRAMRVKDLSDPGVCGIFEHEISNLTCRTVIIDSFSEKVYGGSGTRVGLDSAVKAGRLLREAGMEFFIAGGIDPENADAIVSAARPDGIDVSGGVESSPGIKSEEKILKLMGAVRRTNI